MEHGIPQDRVVGPLSASDRQDASRHGVVGGNGKPTYRVILVVTFASLCAACSFNTDPAVHPPRGMAPPPPTGSTAPPSIAPAFAAPIQVPVSAPAYSTVRATPPVRPARAVQADSHR